jgi:hypothetical protein
MVANPKLFEEALALALQLTPQDKIRLVERVESTLDRHSTDSAAPVESVEDISPTWTDEEVQAMLNQPPMTLTELVEWLRSTTPPEPWGDLRDDEDAAEYVHRMCRPHLRG